MARGLDNSHVIHNAVTRQVERLLKVYLLACTAAASHVQLSKVRLICSLLRLWSLLLVCIAM